MSRWTIAQDAPAAIGRALRLLLVATVLGLTGCSVRGMAVDALGDALAGSSAAWAEDADVELVGAATPFALKTIESLIAEAPAHRGLLLAAARGFTQYAYVYVQLPADELEDSDVGAAYARRARARELYLRARDYGLRGLASAHPGWAAGLATDPAATLERARADDVALLHWTATAWAGAIGLGKDAPALLADLPAVEAFARRALELDETHDEGAVHGLLLALELGRPGAAREAAIAAARPHFERAVALSGGALATPWVTWAETAAVARQDRAEFERALGAALAVDAGGRPAWRLENTVMQRRARWLLGRADLYFAE